MAHEREKKKSLHFAFSFVTQNLTAISRRRRNTKLERTEKREFLKWCCLLQISAIIVDFEEKTYSATVVDVMARSISCFAPFVTSFRKTSFYFCWPTAREEEEENEIHPTEKKDVKITIKNVKLFFDDINFKWLLRRERQSEHAELN